MWTWEVEFRVPSLLRDYAEALRDYTRQLQGSSPRQTTSLSSLEASLRQQKTKILEMQDRRHKCYNQFDAGKAEMKDWDSGRLAAEARTRRRELEALPADITPDGFDTPFVEERNYLEDLVAFCEEILRSRGVQVSVKREPSFEEKAVSDMISRLRTEIRIKQAFDELKREFPEQARVIERRERKLIDSLREED